MKTSNFTLSKFVLFAYDKRENFTIDELIEQFNTSNTEQVTRYQAINALAHKTVVDGVVVSKALINSMNKKTPDDEAIAKIRQHIHNTNAKIRYHQLHHHDEKVEQLMEHLKRLTFWDMIYTAGRDKSTLPELPPIHEPRKRMTEEEKKERAKQRYEKFKRFKNIQSLLNTAVKAYKKLYLDPEIDDSQLTERQRIFKEQQRQRTKNTILRCFEQLENIPEDERPQHKNHTNKCVEYKRIVELLRAEDAEQDEQDDDETHQADLYQA